MPTPAQSGGKLQLAGNRCEIAENLGYDEICMFLSLGFSESPRLTLLTESQSETFIC